MYDSVPSSANEKPASPVTPANILWFVIAILLLGILWYSYRLYQQEKDAVSTIANPFSEDITANPFITEMVTETDNPFGEEAPINPFDQFDREANTYTGAYENPF